MSISSNRFAECAEAIASAGRDLAALGWTPATSSNFSARIDANHVAITISGRDKGRLSAADVMVVDLQGLPVETAERPSAETLLHTQLYARDPQIGAVLHTHSRVQTVASRLYAGAGEIVIEGYELLKAFSGFTTHQCSIRVPVFDNTQDMPALVREVDAGLARGEITHGYLIEGHGIYTWGHSMGDARRHLDAFEFLLACELDLRMLR
jgi:methylthioribulose-1-phosphate dehydratase